MNLRVLHVKLLSAALIGCAGVTLALPVAAVLTPASAVQEGPLRNPWAYGEATLSATGPYVQFGDGAGRPARAGTAGSDQETGLLSELPGIIRFGNGPPGRLEELLAGGLAAIPEPTTLIAGALLLLPFGVSTVRVLRRGRK